MGKKTIQDIARILVEKNALDARAAEQFVSAMFSVIQQALEQGQQVKVRGLGTFKIIDVDARESVNVNTGERVLIAGHGKLSFSPDTTMRELVNKPFSQFETVVLNDGVEFEDTEAPAEDIETQVEEVENVEISVDSSENVETPIEEVEAPATETDTTVDDEEITELPKVERLVQEETLAEEIPAEETPAEETPAEETPAEEDFVEKSAVEEPITEEPSAEKAAEEEPVIEEPSVAEEPVVEETSVAEEPAVDEEAPAEEPETEEDTPAVETLSDLSKKYREEISDDDDDDSSSSGRWILGVLGVLLLMAACAAGGYYFGYGQGLEKGMAVIKEAKDSLSVVAKTDSVAAEQNDSLVARQDSVSQTKTPVEAVQKPQNTPAPVEAQKEVPAQPKQETPAKPKAETPATPKTETPAPELDQYAAKDVRVRYGGYRIVGLDHTEKIRPGDTPSRIARRTLGEGMECYIEVYNGWGANPQLKEGQTVKIPKVVLKKKKRQ